MPATTENSGIRDNPIRNRLTAASLDLLAIIKQEGRV